MHRSWIPLPLALCWLALGRLPGQVITLPNPSFEGTARHSSLPEGWLNAGHPDESPPDVFPNDFFGPKPDAADGETYLGLVTRDNATQEAVFAPLSNPMLAGRTYRLSVALARAEVYLSPSRTAEVVDNFNRPVRLCIWGRNALGDQRELLAVTEPLPHPNWMEYHFDLRPSRSYTHLELGVTYAADAKLPYNGNLLMDRLSALQAVANDDDQRSPPRPTEAGGLEGSIGLRGLNAAELEELLCDLLQSVRWDPRQRPTGRRIIDVILSDHEAPEALYFLVVAASHYGLKDLALVVDDRRPRWRSRLRHLSDKMLELCPEEISIPVLRRSESEPRSLLRCEAEAGIDLLFAP